VAEPYTPDADQFAEQSLVAVVALLDAAEQQRPEELDAPAAVSP
jgi:hypothetical protein